MIKRALVLGLAILGRVEPAAAQETPDDWASEFIARDAGGDGVIDGPAFEGITQDAVYFPPGFFTPDSANFWSYVMIWRGPRAGGLTAARLEAMLVDYYDRLAALTGGNPGTRARIAKEGDGLAGAVLLDDMFAQAGPIGLNVRARGVACADGRSETVLTVAASRPLGLPGGLLEKAARELQCAAKAVADE